MNHGPGSRLPKLPDLVPNRTLPVGAVLLAAGASSRLGAPKQLIHYQGCSLVRRAAISLLESGCRPIIVVIGACAAVADELAGLDVYGVENLQWREGMSSSIRTGLREVRRIQPEVDAILMSVCDQPFVTGPDLRALVQFYRQSAIPIAASQYGSTLGVPAIFREDLFSELMALEGDAGARRVIQEHKAGVAAFSLSNAELDVDQTEDVQRLR